MRWAVAVGAAVMTLSWAASGRSDVPSPSPSPAQLAPGDVIPPFDAEGVDGVMHHVSFGKQPTVLLFFLSSCPHCHKQIPDWNRAFERRGPGVNVVGVMLDHEPPGFFLALPVSFPVVRIPREFSSRLKITRVPLTARVGAGGKVEDVGSGPTDPIRLGELFRK
ncbi:MAG TPA: hypothetical protein VGN09_14090 [Vicinamibacteria bacterium]|jgi:hypothetical protein